MPIVEAGSKVNFITGHTADGNSQADFGKNVWIAQSFPLAAQFTLFRCPFKMWDSQPGSRWYFALRNALPDGTPTGPNIAEDSKSPDIHETYHPGKWILIDFTSFPSLPLGMYALLAYVPDSPSANQQHISAQANPRLYPGGLAYRSTDSGVTWSGIPNTNLLFQIWGYQPPPAPPPPSEIGNWYQDEPTYPVPAPDFSIVTHTNVKVHQFLRWSVTPPQKHIIPVIVRGAVTGTYIDQCFVVYTDVEQQEPGDTTTHTFLFTDWPVCQTRYYYLWATKLAQLMPSASPIYTKHRYAPPAPTTIKLYSDKLHGLTTVDGMVYRNPLAEIWSTIHDSTGLGAEPDAGSVNLSLQTSTVSGKWKRLDRNLMTFDLSPIPVGSTIQAATFHANVVGKWKSHTFNPSYACYLSTPTVNNNISTPDYLKIGTLPISNIIPYAAIPAAGPFFWTLTTLGLAALVPGQIAKLGIREATFDAPNISPPWLSNRGVNVILHNIETPTPANRPYLEVTYLPP